MGGDETRQGFHRPEMFAVVRRTRVKLDPETLLHRDPELERIDRVESQTVTEQRRSRIDLLSLDVLQVERFDDQQLEFLDQRVHHPPHIR